jgi:hypothetical protein
VDSLSIQPDLKHERFVGSPLKLSFGGALRPEQEAAGDVLLRRDTGVLAATTAFGKTVLAAWLIAQRGVNAPNFRADLAVAANRDPRFEFHELYEALRPMERGIRRFARMS